MTKLIQLSFVIIMIYVIDFEFLSLKTLFLTTSTQIIYYYIHSEAYSSNAELFVMQSDYDEMKRGSVKRKTID